MITQTNSNCGWSPVITDTVGTTIDTILTGDNSDSTNFYITPTNIATETSYTFKVKFVSSSDSSITYGTPTT
jgi:hypothetical protein